MQSRSKRHEREFQQPSSKRFTHLCILDAENQEDAFPLKLDQTEKITEEVTTGLPADSIDTTERDDTLSNVVLTTPATWCFAGIFLAPATIGEQVKVVESVYLCQHFFHVHIICSNTP